MNRELNQHDRRKFDANVKFIIVSGSRHVFSIIFGDWSRGEQFYKNIPVVGFVEIWSGIKLTAASQLKLTNDTRKRTNELGSSTQLISDGLANSQLSHNLLLTVSQSFPTRFDEFQYHRQSTVKLMHVYTYIHSRACIFHPRTIFS